MKWSGAFALALLVAACDGKVGAAAPDAGTTVSGSPTPPSEPGEPGAFDADAAAPDAATVCNDAPLYGASVDLIGVSGDPPTPSGGKIYGAIYLLRSAEYYGPDAPTGRLSTIGKMTLDLGDTTANLAVSSQDESRSTALLTMTGPTSLTFTATCRYPAGDAGVDLPAAAEYSADSGLTLFFVPVGAPNARIVEHFTPWVNKR